MIAENIRSLVVDVMRDAGKFIPDDAERLRSGIETLLREQLEKRLADMNLVSKEDFQAHNLLLNRLKQRVVELEARIETLEQSNDRD